MYPLLSGESRKNGDWTTGGTCAEQGTHSLDAPQRVGKTRNSLGERTTLTEGRAQSEPEPTAVVQITGVEDTKVGQDRWRG